MNPERKLESITIKWNNGESLYLTQSEIDKMLRAGEALELIQIAQDIAGRLVRV